MTTALEKAKNTLQSVRTRGKAELSKRVHTMTAMTACGAVGYYEGAGNELPAPGAMDGKFFWGCVALGVAEFAGNGKGAQIAQSTADGLLSVSSYQMGKVMGAASKSKRAKTGGVDDATAFETVLED